MPDPETFDSYPELVQQAILDAFRASTVDASRRDDRITDAEVWVSKNGAGWAFALMFVLVVAAIVFLSLGNVTAGGLCLAAPLVQALIGRLGGGKS